jgi:hypothetical protein
MRRLGRVPLGRNHSSRTIHSDSEAISNDAMADETRCSAHMTPPLPPSSKSPPSRSAISHWRRFGAGVPRSRMKA